MLTARITKIVDVLSWAAFLGLFTCLLLELFLIMELTLVFELLNVQKLVFDREIVAAFDLLVGLTVKTFLLVLTFVSLCLLFQVDVPRGRDITNRYMDGIAPTQPNIDPNGLLEEPAEAEKNEEAAAAEDDDETTASEDGEEQSTPPFSVPSSPTLASAPSEESQSDRQRHLAVVKHPTQTETVWAAFLCSREIERCSCFSRDAVCGCLGEVKEYVKPTDTPDQAVKIQPARAGQVFDLSVSPDGGDGQLDETPYANCGGLEIARGRSVGQ